MNLPYKNKRVEKSQYKNFAGVNISTNFKYLITLSPIPKIYSQ